MTQGRHGARRGPKPKPRRVDITSSPSTASGVSSPPSPHSSSALQLPDFSTLSVPEEDPCAAFRTLKLSADHELDFRALKESQECERGVFLESGELFRGSVICLEQPLVRGILAGKEFSVREQYLYQNFKETERAESVVNLMLSKELGLRDCRGRERGRVGCDVESLEAKALEAVFWSNSIPQPSNSNEELFALCPFLARFNHSCGPNCCLLWRPEFDAFALIATKRIKKGEELTFAYSSHTLLAPQKERRAALANSFGFHCICSSCGPEADVQKLSLLKRRAVEMGDRRRATARYLSLEADQLLEQASGQESFDLETFNQILSHQDRVLSLLDEEGVFDPTFSAALAAEGFQVSLFALETSFEGSACAKNVLREEGRKWAVRLAEALGLIGDEIGAKRFWEYAKKEELVGLGEFQRDTKKEETQKELMENMRKLKEEIAEAEDR